MPNQTCADGATIHPEEAIEELLRVKPGRIHLAILSGYSPELNSSGQPSGGFGVEPVEAEPEESVFGI